MTTKDEIATWFGEGKGRGATHMLVVVDEFDYEDYPVYVQPSDKPNAVQAAVDRYDSSSMQRVLEVYDLSMDAHVQLNQPRAWHVPS